MTHEARIAGADAEQLVVDQFTAAGWMVRQTALLDYANKSDVLAVCPGRSPFPVQVSLGSKSQGEQERLAARGVHPLAVVSLEGSGMTAPEYACANWCDRQLCPDEQTPISPIPIAKIGH